MSFSYSDQPLADPSGQIRLLRVLSGRRYDPIVCTLETVQRKAEPKYVAVSYTWGEARPVEIICVNGKPLHVRHNCFFALWQLRLHKVGLPIWIDSICIDQSNNYEKSRQVLLMGSIYAHAELTVASIGEGLQLRAVARDIGDCELVLLEASRNSFDRDGIHRVRNAWRNLSSLASNRYFKRLWVVQELYHSKDIAILCGEDSLSWQDLQPFFLQIAEITSKHATCPFHPFSKVSVSSSAPKTEWTDEITGHGFTGVILSFGEGECTDPRDKIYGLLSLAQDRRWLVNFPIDYNRPLTDVLRDVVSRIANESRTENTSRLIANMLRWFHIEPDSIPGQMLLRSTDRSNAGPLVPWSNFLHNVVPFESVWVWRVYNLPLSSNTVLPHTKNVVMHFNGESIEGKGLCAHLNWRQVCIARGRIIKSNTGILWIAGPEVKPGDFIVEFRAMRDEQDEYSTVVICRLPNRKSSRMDIVDQATALMDLEVYDAMHKTAFHQPWTPEGISKLERHYLSSRMLFARPCENRMIVCLRPFDLIKLVMLRGHIVDRIRYPILSMNSECYTTTDDEDNKAEVQARTYTITQSRQEIEDMQLKLSELSALEQYCNVTMDMLERPEALLRYGWLLDALEALLGMEATQRLKVLETPEAPLSPDMLKTLTMVLQMPVAQGRTALKRVEEHLRLGLLRRLKTLQLQAVLHLGRLSRGSNEGPRGRGKGGTLVSRLHG